MIRPGPAGRRVIEALDDRTQSLGRHVLGQHLFVGRPAARQSGRASRRRQASRWLLAGKIEEMRGGREEPPALDQVFGSIMIMARPGLPLPSDGECTSNRTSNSTRTGISWNFAVSSRLRGSTSSGLGLLSPGTTSSRTATIGPSSTRLNRASRSARARASAIAFSYA